ncbi:MAG: HEAT repeat domain-containing protein [Cyanobacteria bacterium]|nr:HEAT repeat domain-containing protein [Cyanobacteriota bacterium]
MDGLFSAEKLALLIQEAKSPAELEVFQENETFKAEVSLNKELEQENSEGEALSLVEPSFDSNPLPSYTEIPSLQDWKNLPPAHRSEVIQTLSKDAMGAMEILLAGLVDDAVNVRRWACAKLSGVDTPEVIEALCFCLLKDTNIGVRRTAGDSLSDIGNPMAEPAMCQALSDPNKLVRWRAARFLFEVGSLGALPFLQAALPKETEFENQLEMNAAITQIQQKQDASSGAASSGPYLETNC